jgi:hypothetical protein
MQFGPFYGTGGDLAAIQLFVSDSFRVGCRNNLMAKFSQLRPLLASGIFGLQLAVVEHLLYSSHW